MITSLPADDARIFADLLSQDPHASLHDLRRAHPIFRAMSLDQLGLRLSRFLEQSAQTWSK